MAFVIFLMLFTAVIRIRRALEDTNRFCELRTSKVCETTVVEGQREKEGVNDEDNDGDGDIIGRVATAVRKAPTLRENILIKVVDQNHKR